MKGRSGRRPAWLLPLIFAAGAALVAAFAFYNSAQPGAVSDETSLSVVDALNGMLARLGLGEFVTNHLVRKTAHFLEYTLLGLLLALFLHSSVKKHLRHFYIPLALGLAAAGVDETIQRFVPGRSGKLGDVLLDFCGVVTGTLVGLLVGHLVERALEKRRGRRHKT